MKRNVFALLIVFCLLTACIFPTYAASPCLVDDAGLLTTAEKAELEQRLNEISARYDVDVVVVTAESIGDSSPMAYADDYYDYHDYSPDGILLLVSMEYSDWWISTTGYGITAFTDAGIEYIGDRVVPYMSDGDFAKAFASFADLCEQFLAQAQTGEPYDYYNLPKDPFEPGFNLIVALVIGLIAAWIATGSMKRKLKSINRQTKADDYVTPGSLQISHSRDFHLYTHLDRRERPKSSGGSSTHRSSSGAAHGGGGGNF